MDAGLIHSIFYYCLFYHYLLFAQKKENLNAQLSEKYRQNQINICHTEHIFV